MRVFLHSAAACLLLLTAVGCGASATSTDDTVDLDSLSGSDIDLTELDIKSDTLGNGDTTPDTVGKDGEGTDALGTDAVSPDTKDTADIATGCTSTAACDDTNPCTDDSCGTDGVCVHAANTAECNDGNACTTGDVCAAKVCGGTAIGCNDDNVCTTDSCDKSAGCVHLANAATCDDGIACTLADTCTAGACVGIASDATCSDGNDCTTDSCDVGTGSCVNLNNTITCTDGDACTTGDVCANGGCVATITVCNDGNVCTTDSCNPDTGACVFTAFETTCDDGDTCTVNDGCIDTVCVGGGKLNCDDKNDCTADSCDALSGCAHASLNATACSDGNACTQSDVCVAGTCVGSNPVACVIGVAPTHRFSFTTDGSDATGMGSVSLFDGATLADGALQLDGVAAYGQINLAGGATELTNYPSATFEAWFTWVEAGQVWTRIFDFGAPDQSGYLFFSPESGNFGEGPANNTPRFAMRTGANSGEEQANAATMLPVGGLTHVAVVIDAPAHEFRLYLNGKLVATRTNTTFTLGDFDALPNLFLGKSSFQDPFFHGSISEFRIYNSALSAADLAISLANGPDVAGNTPGDGQCDWAVCNPANGMCQAQTKADGTACSDGVNCTIADACMAGVCLPGALTSCMDDDLCTIDDCNPLTGACSNVPNSCAQLPYDATSSCQIATCDELDGVCKVQDSGTVWNSTFKTSAGWKLQGEWQIGLALASTDATFGNPDPAGDWNGDGYLAGTVIGGNISNTPHDWYYLTSPAIDLSAQASSTYLDYTSYDRSLYLDFGIYANLSGIAGQSVSIEFSGDGKTWTVATTSQGDITSSVWNPSYQINQGSDFLVPQAMLTNHFQFRIGYKVTAVEGIVPLVSGVSIDGASIYVGNCWD